MDTGSRKSLLFKYMKSHHIALASASHSIYHFSHNKALKQVLYSLIQT